MTDTRIPEERVEQIKRLLHGRVRDLCVLLREGCVVLLGRAASYHVKQLAQHHVLKLLRVTALVNEIEVQYAHPASDPEVSPTDG
jgi:hypothetical protein